jgi:peptide/nickel transport system substrate-binding protein
MRHDNRTTRALAATAAGALLLGLAACGSDGGDEARVAPAFDAASTNVVNASGDKGGTLNLVNAGKPDHLDPARTYLAWMWNLSRSYARTLVTYAPKPGKEGLHLVPDLATEAAQSPDGGKTWKYTLKDGIKFEDGSPITSRDVKYGIERTFAQDVLEGGPAYLKDWLDNGQEYPGPYRDTSPDKLGLASVKTPDDKTIIFTLRSAFQDFPYVLAMPFASPVPRDHDTGVEYDAKPVSSGPYRIESYRPDSQLVLARNRNWDPDTDPVRRALPDRIVVKLDVDQEEIDRQLMAGGLDLDTNQAGVGPTVRGEIISDPDKKKNADAALNGFVRFLSIQTAVPPFDNIHCRRAVHYAADKMEMLIAHGGPLTGGDIADNLLPPTFREHRDINLYGSAGNRGDVARAKDELKQCGRPNGFSTVLAARTERAKEVKEAEALKTALARVGITVTIRKFSQGDYFGKAVGVPAVVKRDGIGLAMSGWAADYPSPYGFFSELVDGRKIKQAGNTNIAELRDGTINGLIDKALAEPDENRRTQLWQQVDEKVMESAAIMPFVYEKTMSYRNPRLTNIFVHQAYGSYDLQALGVQ